MSDRVADRLADRLRERLSSAGEVESLVLPILDALELHSPSRSRSQPQPDAAARVLERGRGRARALSLVQSAVVTDVYLAWSGVLGAGVPLRALLVPPRSSPYAAEVAASSYATLVALLSRAQPQTATAGSPLTHPATLELVADLLADLARHFPLAELYPSVFAHPLRDPEVQLAKWSALLKHVVAVPAKVANAAGAFTPHRCRIPDELIWSNYFVAYAQSFVALLDSSPTPSPAALSTALAHLIHHAPSLFVSSSSPPSFLTLLLPALLPLAFPADPSSLIRRSTAARTVRAVLAELAPRDSAKLIRSILETIDKYAADGVRSRSRGASWLLHELVGELDDDSQDGTARVALEMVLDSKSEWGQGLARAVVEWVTTSDKERQTVVRERLLQRAGDVWCDERAIRESTVPSRLFISTLVLYTIHALPTPSSALLSFSRSPTFLSAISASLSHLRPLPRLLGMLLAESVSARTLAPGSSLRPLDFGDVWLGGSPELAVVRTLRASLVDEGQGEGWADALRAHWSADPSPASPAPRQQPTADPTRTPPPPPPAPARRPLISIIGSDSDSEDLTPFPLPSAPSTSYLETLSSADASEYATALPSTKSSATRRRGKLRAPVYVPELVAYLRGKDPEGNEEQSDEQAERVECALREGEQLVRRKKGWGTELEEHSVDLAFVLVGLQDQFESDGFDQSKLAILAALVAACPTKVAPAIIEQYFFPHYSVTQRHAMLTALALGARELAGYQPAPKPLVPSVTAVPPVDLFPSKRLPPALHQRLVGPTPPVPPAAPSPLEALTASLAATALSSTASSAESSIPLAARSKLLSVRHFASASAPTPTAAAFTLLAAEYFLGPLINRFWAHLASAKRRGDALTEPLTLSRYLSTLALLLDAARHSAHFLAWLAPQALELVLALRAVDEDSTVEGGEMEILLVVFDALVALDGGYSIMRTVEGGSGLVGDCREWAADVFEREEASAGKEGVGRMGRAAAGTLLRLDELQTRWMTAVGW